MIRINSRKTVSIAAILSCTVLLILAAVFMRNNSPTQARDAIYAMDTYMEIQAVGRGAESAINKAKEEILRLDALWSAENPDSEISRINRDGGGVVSEDTALLIRRALEINEKTGGCFDISIYPVKKLWGFTDGNYHVPDEKEISEKLSLADSDLISLTKEGNAYTLTLGEGQQIDLGGIAKGYTSSRIMEIFKEAGITSGMVSLGGNVQVAGTKTDGSEWNIGIRDPYGQVQESICAVRASDKAIITSGGYERYFEEDGKTYIHIIDPATGRPVSNDFLSVTVITADGTLGDALSTSLYIMGPDKAISFWQENTDTMGGFQMIFITHDKTIHLTDGLADSFTLIDNNYKYKIIDKNSGE